MMHCMVYRWMMTSQHGILYCAVPAFPFAQVPIVHVYFLSLYLHLLSSCHHIALYLQVGVKVRAEVEVDLAEAKVNVNTASAPAMPADTSLDYQNGDLSSMKNSGKCDGYHIQMTTRVERLQDGAMIATGTQSVWIPYTTTMTMM